MAENKTTRTRKAPAAADQATPTVSPDVQALIEQNNMLMEQINQLTLAVIAGREAPKAHGDEKATIKIENVIGYAIAFEVTDPRTGTKRAISLQKLGDSALLRPSEIQEAIEKYSHFFDRGYLSAPEYKADNANVIRDVKAWVDGLEGNEVMTAVEKIDSLPTLYLLYNWLEEQRFTHVDANGNPIIGAKDEQGKTLYYKLEERPHVDSKILVLGMAVKRQIDALNGVTVTLDK